MVLPDPYVKGGAGSSGVTSYVLGIGRALGGSRYAMQPVNLNGAPEG